MREALSALEAEGYVLAKRGATGGWFVTELGAPFAAWAVRTEHDLDDIVDFRLAVEAEAARFRVHTTHPIGSRRDAAGRRAARQRRHPREYRLADVAFHAAIAIASRNDRLAVAVERARGELFEPADELWKHGRIESLADHRQILDAIERQDAEAAARAMGVHIERTRREVRALVRAAARA